MRNLAAEVGAQVTAKVIQAKLVVHPYSVLAQVVIGSGVLVIGLADNALRPILVGRDTGLPDWVILVTTLGGIAALGITGIVVGPVVAGLFIAGWAILRDQRGVAPA